LAQDALAAADLDVLVVLDNAIDPFVAALLHSRAAPVQVVVMGAGSGHLQTQGLRDSVDFMVLGDGETPSQAQDLVAEQVVRLGDIGTFFAPMAPVTRAEMFNASAMHSLFASRNYYIVPRMLVALHPAMDELFEAVLTADQDAVVICLFEPLQLLWLEKVRARLNSTLGVNATRVKFVSRMHRRDLWALMTAAAVVLDTFPVGMGVLAVEAAFIGAPVVTVAGAQPLRQPAHAVARRLGLENELVAQSVPQAAGMAVAIATNMSLRFHVRSALLQRSSALAWTEDPNLPPVKDTRTGAALSPAEEAVFAAVDATDEQFLQAGLASSADVAARLRSRHLAESDGLGTLSDWLRFLGRVGWRAAVARREHLSEPVPLGSLLGSKW
jgi:predicted O-linked N-acetylglucosamine transferase (SPINDLY family)